MHRAQRLAKIRAAGRDIGSANFRHGGRLALGDAVKNGKIPY